MMSSEGRTPFICGNWKLHKTIAESLELATAIKNAVGPIRDVEVAVSPVFTSLHAVAKRLEGSSVGVAAQNCYWEDQGAFTGEVSCKMIKDAGAQYVIIGHSERRQFFGETDQGCNLKLKAALKHGLKPILCVGESEKERDAGETFGRVRTQLDGGLDGIEASAADVLTIAYEPVWAIGTGRTATPQQAEEVHAFIRGLLAEKMSSSAKKVRIQYGGSVKPDNAATLLSQPNIDGALVGGASLKADDFLKIVKYRQT
jgi:triosephosphate isomerase (TIM)